MDIDGLGEERAMQFLKEGLIENVADIYELTVEKLVELEGFGEISANNLLEAIEALEEAALLSRAVGARHRRASAA